MRIAPHHNGRAFGHAQITLAQLDALAFGRLDELLNHGDGSIASEFFTWSNRGRLLSR